METKEVYGRNAEELEESVCWLETTGWTRLGEPELVHVNPQKSGEPTMLQHMQTMVKDCD